MKNFLEDKNYILNSAINSVSGVFNQERYGIRGCAKDNCYDHNLIKLELLAYQEHYDPGIIEEDTINIYWGFFNEDPYNSIIALGTDLLQFSKEYSSDLSIFQNLDFSGSASGRFLVLKEPIESSSKSTWFNTIFNHGVIPDQVFRSPVIYNGYRYYVSRNIVYLPVESSLISFT